MRIRIIIDDFGGKTSHTDFVEVESIPQKEGMFRYDEENWIVQDIVETASSLEQKFILVLHKPPSDQQ